MALDAFPRFLLKLPFIVRLSVAILSVAFFLILYMMVSPGARTPLMLAIPVALVAWIGFQTVETIVVVGAAASLFILFAYSLAAVASLRARTARAAFLFAAGVIAFLVTAPPLLTAAVRPLRLIPGMGWHELWNWFEALDPIAVLDSFELGQHQPRDIPPRAFEMVIRFFRLYLPATLLLPVEMVLRFRRIATRA